MSSNTPAKRPLTYKGPSDLRSILVLSTLSGHPVIVEDIRPFAEDPGLTEWEVGLVKLLEELSNGTKVEINTTGTQLYYRPGLLFGGSLTHDCGLDRSIGYFLEPLCSLAPFCRKPLSVRLLGITNDRGDNSPDAIKSGWLSVLKRFYLDDEGLEILVKKRGLRPGGGGEIVFNAPICKQLRTVQLTTPGKVKRIRGIAYACKVAPTICNRMLEAAKSVLQPLVLDVYVFSDHKKGAGGGNSPGFGICLTAECTNGVEYVGEALSHPLGSLATPLAPESVGEEAAKELLGKIFVGGNCDETAQSLAFLLMALGQKDVSKIVSGSLTEFSVRFLRILRDFLAVTFKIDSQQKVGEDDEIVKKSEKLEMACVGVGYSNFSRVML